MFNPIIYSILATTEEGVRISCTPQITSMWTKGIMQKPLNLLHDSLIGEIMSHKLQFLDLLIVFLRCHLLDGLYHC